MRFRGLLLLAIWQCSTAPAEPMHASPPAQPNGPPTTSTSVTTFAIDRLFLGDTDRSGNPSATSWKAFGYDIDGHITTKDSTDVCVAAIKTYQIDGQLGIDNAWGSALLPLVQGAIAAPAPSDDVNAFIASGAWTLLLQVVGLDGTPDQTAKSLAAQVFVGGATTFPTFDMSTDWPVTPSSVNDDATIASGARVQFNRVYVSNGTIVATGATQALTIPLIVLVYSAAQDGGPSKPLRSTPLTLRVSNPIITLSTTGENGTIAGVIVAADGLAAEKQLAHGIGGAVCDYAVPMTVLQTEEILDDGTNTPGVPCTATSIGLGFHAARVANPTMVGQDPAPLVDQCDAGAD